MNSMLEERNCRKILVGMSGGLDSTYTAWRIKQMGFEVAGAVLKMTDGSETAAAFRAAEQIGVPIYEIDCREAFERYVVGQFLNEYQSGRTPNPCVNCNRFVKIDALCRFAEANGYDHVATGHYAHILLDEVSARWFVRRAAESRKDQSYVLWRLTQKQLSMLVTPLASAEKTDVRRQMAEMGVEAAKAKESQDICFIPDGDYAAYIEKRIGDFPKGDFLTPDGVRIGTHKGIIRYTVGQRKGLGISAPEPLYVGSISAENNTVTLTAEAGLYQERAIVRHLVYQKLPPKRSGSELAASLKIRYAAPAQAALVRWTDENEVTVTFSKPVRALTPGQSAVFYECGSGSGDVLFGGVLM